MKIDSIIINFYDENEGENYSATLSNLNGEEYPNNLDENTFAQQVFEIVRKALSIKDSNSF